MGVGVDVAIYMDWMCSHMNGERGVYLASYHMRQVLLPCLALSVPLSFHIK